MPISYCVKLELLNGFKEEVKVSSLEALETLMKISCFLGWNFKQIIIKTKVWKKGEIGDR